MATESDQLTGMIDIDSDSAPNVERDRLYRLWEEGNWSAKALDFSQDALDWRERLDDHQREAVIWNYSMFLDGEESVTVTLAPFMNAVTRYEDRIFLGTQIADEARHHVFFDRFLREVAGIGNDLASTLTITKPNLTPGYLNVFSELDRVSARLCRTPHSLPLLAQGVTLYHLVIEGMLAHTGQHYLREYGQKNQIFPGFSKGINFVARDESRHIAFGIQLLRDLVTTRPECKAAAITMLNRVLPWAAGVFVPPNLDWSYITQLGYTAQEVFAFSLRSIETKLKRAGIQPSEVLELVKIGYADPHPVQAERMMTLIEGGVLGSQDDPPAPSEKTLDALFNSIGNVAAWAQERQPVKRPLSIQWKLDGAEPRYLELGGSERPQVKTGRFTHPTLTLHTTSHDWVRISSGHLNQQRAILTRRLKLEGDWSLALRLPKILPA